MGEDPQTPIRVVIADDSRDFRLLLRSVIALDGRSHVVGEAGDGLEAIALVESQRPHVALLDLSMPGLGGMAAIAEIHRRAPGTAVVVMSGFDATRMADAAARAGAAAYVEKGTALERLVDVVVDAADASGTGVPDVRTTASPAPPVISVDDVLAYITHELQTPVTVIAGLASTLRGSMEQLDAATAATCADAIERNSRRLQTLLGTIADARRVEAGQLVVARETTDVAAFLTGLEPHLLAIAGSAAHRVHVDPTGALGVQALLDTRRAAEAVAALVDNAVIHAGGDGPIEVTAVAGEGSVRIEVRDHGRGLDPATHGALFRAFSRLGSTARGAGLGLYLARGVAVAHGGSATVDSPGDGGLRVSLVFPVSARGA